jgi:hypothetical protein
MSNSGNKTLLYGDSRMKSMRPEVQMIYQNTVSNLSAIKKQQWIITNYAVVLFAGVGSLVHSLNIKPSPCSLWLLRGLIILGILGTWYFLIKMQCDSRRERETLNRAIAEYFSHEERNILGLGYANIG